MRDDEWLKELVSQTPMPVAPRADIADRVIAELRTIETAPARDWVSPMLLALASMAAIWLVWLAIPAWQHLSSPLVSFSERMLVAIDSIR